jgi:hypothetical protein
VSRYAVRVLSAGTARIRGPEVFWMDAWDEELPLALNVTLIQGHGITALVNATPPDSDAYVRERFPRMRYLVDAPDGDLVRGDEHRLPGLLASVGLTPADVTHVLLTPLELYSTGSLHELREAQVCITRRGWVHFHTTHEHPHDSRWRSFPEPTLVDLVTDSWDRVRLLDDEDEIAPGLRTWWSGTHHRESMVVEVDTTAGTVAVSDSYFTYANVERDHPIGLCESFEEALACHARVRRTAQHLVPIHEPAVFERHPGGVIAAGPA